MSKAFKFADNNYLDSTGVVHERTPLNEILNNMGDSVPINSIFEYDGNTVPSGYEEVSDPNDYSTTEKKIGKWINGKPLYRKVMEFGNLPNNTSLYKNHEISNIDKIIGIKAIGTDGTQFYPIPFVPTAYMYSNTVVALRANKTQVGVFASTDFTSHTATIILEYTKTTD